MELNEESLLAVHKADSLQKGLQPKLSRLQAKLVCFAQKELLLYEAYG